MPYNIASSWRGVVGAIKATHRPGSLEEFIRLLPEGIGVVHLSLGIKTEAVQERFDAMEVVKEKIAELAALNVDLIHPQGSGVFILRGYKGAAKIVSELEKKHGIPIVTTVMTMIEALRSLEVKRMVCATYSAGKNETKKKHERTVRYFSDAGLEILGMEGIPVSSFSEVGRLSFQEVYTFTKKLYLKHQNAQGILMIGSGWRVLNVIQLLEQDLGVPVVHPVPARVWAVQKRLYVRQPVKGYGRLLEKIP